MARNGKPQLSVFKGREAKLNNAILLVLAIDGPLNIRQVYKRIMAKKDLKHTRYRVVNRRMKALEKEDYIIQVRTERIPQGFLAKLYQPTLRTYLAFAVNRVNFDEFVKSASTSEIITVLAILINTIKK